nr:agamous-like MADS-box protein AGL104 [Ipomoea batatas]
MDLQQQLSIAEAKLRAFEPDIRKLASFNELEACQHRLVEALAQVRQRKELKLSSSSTTPTFYNDAMSQTSGNGDSYSGVHVLSDGQQWQPSFSFYPSMKKSYYATGLEKKSYNIISSRTFLAQIDIPLVSIVVKLVLVYFDRYAIHANRIKILPATKRGGQEVAGGSIGLGDDSGEAIVGEEGIVGPPTRLRSLSPDSLAKLLQITNTYL